MPRGGDCTINCLHPNQASPTRPRLTPVSSSSPAPGLLYDSVFSVSVFSVFSDQLTSSGLVGYLLLSPVCASGLSSSDQFFHILATEREHRAEGQQPWGLVPDSPLNRELVTPSQGISFFMCKMTPCREHRCPPPPSVADITTD